MARSLNKVTIIGRIQPNDPELRYTQNGQPVCTFKVVTDEGYKDKDGNMVERSEWHRIVYWGKAGELIAQYMKKGRRIYVEGRLQTRQWEQDGQSRYTTEIVGQDFLFLDGNERDDGGSSSTQSSGEPMRAPAAAGSDEDDLPF
ncbi:MAG: single-stranded DNA-binding protein [Ignavibacteriae bacterium]|nr:single-stranded DNA-binding protein [Ignavibacteriota bacterium]MCB9217057.1 single-stranded DNA-binding protein [Ignavibacteria bacterium]